MNRDDLYSVTNYLSPLESIVRSDGEETLGTVLSLVNTSHKPVFIFDSDNTFLGLISPDYALYKHHYPYTTKVKSIVFMPPHITEKTPLYDVVDHMLSLRIITLPVFDEKKNPVGVIRAKPILKGLSEDKDLMTYMSRTLQPRSPITAPIDSTVEDIYQIMRQKRKSRIILVNEEGALSGIIAKSDLMNAFLHPTPKQRFSKKIGDKGFSVTFDEEKEYRREDPARKFSVEMVNTASADTPMNEVIVRLIDSERNSIVLTDRDNRPRGFLSIRDLLETVATLRPEEELQVSFNRPSKDVSEEELEEAVEHLHHFAKKLNKRIPLKRVEVNFEEPKYANGQTAMFNTSVVVTPVEGEKLIAKTQRRIFLDGVRSATDQIEKQERRDSDERGHHFAAPL